MLSSLINTIYRDSNGNQVVYSDNIIDVIYYDTSSESWDRQSTGASWYLEAGLPNDSFLFGLDENIWQPFNYKGAISSSFSSTSGLTLSITKAEARGGLTSNGKWTISGDFSVSILVNISNYYNEYKSKTASGLSVSISNLYKVRASVYFDGSSVILKSQYTDGVELKYLGWLPIEESSATLTDKVVKITISRASEVVSCNAEIDGTSYDLGEASGSTWQQACWVELEIETEQYNSLSTNFVGFFVDSGTVSGFSSIRKDRSSSTDFPEESIIVYDNSGLSIIDVQNTTLWMRFVAGSDRYFIDSNSLSASNGRLFCGNSSGLYVIDFVEDKVFKFDSSGKYESIDSISYRNSSLRTVSSSPSVSIPADSVNSVSSIYKSGSVFSSAATVSGLSLLKDQTYIKTTQEPHMDATITKLTQNGNVYWYCTSTSGGVGISVKESVDSSWNSLIDGFSPSRSYTRSSTPFSLSTDRINTFSVSEQAGYDVLAVGTDYGIDVIKYPNYKKFYGVSRSSATINDPSFEGYTGRYWFINTNCYIPAIFATRSSEWFTDSSYSAKFYVGSRMLDAGFYTELYQDIDFTNLDYMFYDIKFLNGTSYYNSITEKFEVIVDGVVYGTYQERGGESEEVVYTDEFIDTSSITGTKRLSFRLTVTADNQSAYAHSTGKAYYVDNIRINQLLPDFSVFSSDTTTSTNITGLELYFSDTSNKALFLNDDGFGSLDLDSDIIDYFVEETTVVSGSNLNVMTSMPV